MPTTKHKISEQIREMLGADGQGSSFKMGSIMEMVEQAINKLLKTEYYGPHISGGEKSVNGFSLVTYDNNGVGYPFTKKGDISVCILPAMPVKLHMNQGLFSIADIKCPDDPFIPIPNGQRNFLRQDPYLSELLGQIGYEPNGLDVVFTKDLAVAGVTGLQIRLLVADLSTLSDHDPLPLAADMATDVVTAVYSILSKKQMPDKIADPVSDKQP